MSAFLGTGALAFASNTTLRVAASGLSLANAMTFNGSGTVDTQSNALALAGVIAGIAALALTEDATLCPQRPRCQRVLEGKRTRDGRPPPSVKQATDRAINAWYRR